MSLRTLAATGFVLAIASVPAAACGGKVSGVSSSSGSSGSSTSTPTPQLPPSGTGRPGRPPPVATAASIASEIAETYCKSFSSCCVSTGQPPIDVARCRQLVADDVEASVSPDLTTLAEDVSACVDTIKGRIGVCSAVDAPWWSSERLALLTPSTVTDACAPIFGFTHSGEPTCTSDASCGTATCAIDQCVAYGPLGTPCAATASCLDGAACIGGKCSPPLDVMQNGACTTDDECRLGLVCAKGTCLPSRDFPGLGKPRFSPYRIGADTCRAYTYL